MASDNPYCLHPGKLNQRVTLQSAATPSTGETNLTMTEVVASVPAQIMPAASAGRAGLEAIVADQVQARMTYLVHIRYRSDIDTTWRMLWGSKTLNIYSCYDPTGTRTYLEMVCYEESP